MSLLSRPAPRKQSESKRVDKQVIAIESDGRERQDRKREEPPTGVGLASRDENRNAGDKDQPHDLIDNEAGPAVAGQPGVRDRVTFVNPSAAEAEQDPGE